MTFKDRTAEFRESIQKLNTTIRMPQKPVSTTSPKQKFTVASAALAFSLKSMEEKLERLAKLANVKSLFEDPGQEIQELTFVLKRETAQANATLESLSAIVKKENKDYEDHADAILRTLRKRLSSHTKKFTQILEIRSKNFENQELNRKVLIGSQLSFEKKMGVTSTMAPGTAGDAVILEQEQRLQQQQIQQQKPRQFSYETRLNEAHEVEKTMAELQGIMQHIAITVEEQGELIERIDENIETSLVNVNSAHQNLLQILRSQSGSRGLIIKMLVALVSFAIVFFVFFV